MMGSGEGAAAARAGQWPGVERQADVLVMGGGPAGAWAALAAARAGCRVILVDKGFLGTSGATAPSNTGTWCIPPGPERERAATRRAARAGGLADPQAALRVLDLAYRGLQNLAANGYPFPADARGGRYLANLRGPDYMRFMRKLVKAAGVVVLDHHPALALLGDADGVRGAHGIDRQRRQSWRIESAAVVVATGGCAYGERMLGATGLTGDGYLMAAEAGASLSGMEFYGQYGIAPAGTSLNKGLIYRWATFYDAAGAVLPAGDDRHVAIAQALLQGKVYARLDLADAQARQWLRSGQPNCFLPFDRQGIDPFVQQFEITLRCEGTVRGIGGIRLADADGATDVPGLYAAGDAASRERLTGAISGGGGPNASWAIASGQSAGAQAARHARRQGAARRGGARSLGGVGLEPGGAAGGADEAVAAVRAHMLPLDRNFFRRRGALEASAHELERQWRMLQAGGGNADPQRRREAAALLATSRHSLAAALLREESRGIHRRLDAPGQLADGARSIRLTGVDRPVPVFDHPPPDRRSA